MADSFNYSVLAYYGFIKISNPLEEVKIHKSFLNTLDATCRIYISEEGINGQLCCIKEDAVKYMEWMKTHPLFKEIEFKIQHWHEQAFPKLVVKYRKYLVGRDKEVDLNNRGELVDPFTWQKMLEQENEALLLDVRNDYEWKVGHFKNAILPKCNTFREFEQYAEQLKQQYNPKEKKVMMYCTAGIRCEIYSALLKEHGFEKVYQLHGGVVKYGLNQGAKHWQGKLFVFDDRLTVPIAEEATAIIGQCQFCQKENETYYNCANMDCNNLFLCCPTCIQEHLGCCSKTCMQAKRLRPYKQATPHKPFRKRHHYLKTE